MAETWSFEDLGDRTLRIWLFSDVTNSSELMQKVQNKSIEPECSFVNASLVADLWLVKAAAFKALADEKYGRLKTHSLHGELVFNLSGSRHIGESFKQYGLSSGIKTVLVGRFDATEEQDEAVLKLVHGRVQPLASLKTYTDLSLLQQTVRCAKAEQSLGDLSGAIITRMAVRDC